MSDKYISVNKELPSCENGHVDESVLICVKNKNKECGILLWDMASFDGSEWLGRRETWETIIGWRPVEWVQQLTIDELREQFEKDYKPRDILRDTNGGYFFNGNVAKHWKGYLRAYKGLSLIKENN
jgi:hypothetical protein